MKKLTGCMIICVLLFSCKKDMDLNQGTIPASQADKFAVTFNIADFSPQVLVSAKGNSISDVPLKGRARYFTYIAYNSAGKEVSRIKQDSTGFTERLVDDPNIFPPNVPLDKQTFGCISDSLVAGNYTIVMIASQSNFSISNRNEFVLDYTFLPLSEASFYYNRGLDSWSRATDTFFKKFSLTIVNKDSQHKATLDRIVGKAEINILDSKPGTIFKFLFVNENEAFRFSNEQPFGNTDDNFLDNEHLLPSIPGKEKLSYSKFIINTATPVDVIIKVYENEVLTASKTIKDVRFYKNKRTVLTGNIYAASPATTGFNVQVNDKFDEGTVVVKF